MDDDRTEPRRATNTVMLAQVGQPPPPSVLAAVLSATGGATPVHVAALPEWGEDESTWRVLGCTDRVLFEVVAHKAMTDWYGSRGERVVGSEMLTAHVRPLHDVAAARFALTEVHDAGSFGDDVRLLGDWTVTFASGDELAVPVHPGNPKRRTALSGIVDTVLERLGE